MVTWYGPFVVEAQFFTEHVEKHSRTTTCWAAGPGALTEHNESEQGVSITPHGGLNLGKHGLEVVTLILQLADMLVRPFPVHYELTNTHM